MKMLRLNSKTLICPQNIAYMEVRRSQQARSDRACVVIEINYAFGSVKQVIECGRMENPYSSKRIPVEDEYWSWTFDPERQSGPFTAKQIIEAAEEKLSEIHGRIAALQ